MRWSSSSEYRWWMFMNIHDHSSTVHQTQFMTINTWWINVVHDLFHEIHMEGFMNSHEFLRLGRINSIHSLFMKVHEIVSWTFRNYYELDKSYFGSWLVQESSRRTFCMNCDELLWTWLGSSFSSCLLVENYELWWIIMNLIRLNYVHW